MSENTSENSNSIPKEVDKATRDLIDEARKQREMPNEAHKTYILPWDADEESASGTDEEE